MRSSVAIRTRPLVGRLPAPRPLVLTPRGRSVARGAVWLVCTAVAAVVVLLVWMAAASLVAPGASAGDGRSGVASGLGAGVGADPAELGAVSVVVGEGDTLWSLARDHAPGRDPRAVVHDVVGLNALGSSTVHVGDTLLVPTR